MSDKELRELDKAIAKALGFKPSIVWAVLNADESALMIDFEREAEARKWWDEHPSVHKDHHLGTLDIYQPYSESIEAAMRVEDRIAELNLQNDYIAHLWEAVGATRNGVNFWTAENFKAFWLCVHATAEQRCRAALAAIEGNNHAPPNAR